MQPLSDTTLAYGERMMTALLGVDALYRGESGDSVGLAVLNMDTEGRFRADSFGGYDAAAACFEDLRREASSLREADRRLYYRQTCDSTLAFIRWRTQGLDFADQLVGFLHVPVAAAADKELDDLESDLDDLLAGMGYAGSLRAKCAAWEARNRVPADEVQDTLEALLGQAWERTEERLMGIPADRSDGMGVKTVTSVPYNARCDYLGRTIEINTDPVLTRPGLKHLAVHEGYPGHYVQFKLRETWARDGLAPADGMLSVVNTASSSVFEGIADAGLRMLEWDGNDDDRVQGLLNRHRAGIGTGAAWRLQAQEWPRDRVTDWLRARSLIGGDGWVTNRMAFISAPSRAVLIWSYWWGERSVLPAWLDAMSPSETDANGPDPARAQSFLTYLYGRMHSVQSVAMFEPEEGEAA